MATIEKEISSKLSDKLYRALSIEERAPIFEKWGFSKDISKEILETEISRWKEETVLQENSLKMRLQSEGLTRRQFGEILHASKESVWIEEVKLAEEEKPLWMKEVDKAFTLNRTHKVSEVTEYNLSYAFRPFLLWAGENIKQYINDRPELKLLINFNELIESLMLNLEKLLIKTGIRTFIFELHVSKELNELTGETSNDRFNSFIEDKLIDPEYLEFIYSEYPVLARLLMTQSIDYIDNIKQCMDRFVKDYHQITKTFSLKNDTLTGIETDLGDSHQKGKTVMRFKFLSGKEILYKPKSLKLLHHFNGLLKWFNSKGFEPQFNQYKTINFQDYAWEEKVEYNSCDSYEQLERYYKRLGGLLGVLYIVNGMDFHSENIIANGEYPTLIDIETLFHHDSKISDDLTETADQRAKEKISRSVLNIGLLPHLSFKTPEGRGIDLGGMSITDEPIPMPIFHIENDQTDEIRFVLKNSIMNKLDQNVPKLNGEMVEGTNFVPEITEGFNKICHIVLKNKDELTMENGMIAQFKQDVIRIIIRATQYYGNFISESTHPDYLRDWVDRDKLMEKVWFTILDPRTIAYEKKDLLYNDIPFFYTTPNTRDLLSSDGEIISNFHDEPSYNLVIDRIKSLNEEMISEQIKFIEMSILSKKEEEKKNVNSQFIENLDVNTEQFIKEATIIGDQLLDQAVYGESNDVTWISLDINYFGQWDVSVVGNGLYNGLSGILLFSSYLHKVTKEERFKVLADKVCETILGIPTFSRDFKSAFFGQGSTIYALSHYTDVFGENERIKSQILDKVRFLGQNVESDEYLDLLGGSAGVIQVLLNAYDQFNFTEALDIAKQYGDHLLMNQRETENGIGWAIPSSEDILGGFSHGTSGIAWSLLRLYQYTDDKKYLETAVKAIEFDRSLFNPEKENWDDLRFNDKESINWCHGAPGIGMSRILYLNYLNDPQLNNEIKIALSTTLKKGLGKSHSLCHGDLGNSELFCLAALNFNNDHHLETARKIGMKVLQEKNEIGKFLTGVPNNIELPGLFLGLSGIGLQLLRLAEPNKVPSVLTLE